MNFIFLLIVLLFNILVCQSSEINQMSPLHLLTDSSVLKNFRMFDIDASGLICRYEFLLGVRTFLSPTTLESEIDELMLKYDVDRSNDLTYKEFAHILSIDPPSKIKRVDSDYVSLIVAPNSMT